MKNDPAMQELAKAARFEAGKPADPTQNMSPEDAQKWKDMNEEHRDKFKTADGPSSEDLGTMISKMAVGDIPADVERYVKETKESNPDYDDAKVWAVAWSRYCKYKNPSSEHCKMNTNDYFKNAVDGLTKLAAGRSLSEIADEIYGDWKKVYFGAVPYLDAMSSMKSIDDNYGLDSGSSIVAYFLANASGWKGDKAKAVKKELQDMLKKSKKFANDTDMQNLVLACGEGILAEGCPDNLEGEDCDKWESNTDKYKNVVKDKHQAGQVNDTTKSEPDNSMRKNPLDPMANWNEGEIDMKDDPRNHPSEGSMIPGLEDRLATEAKKAMEHATPEALKKYLHEHPDADKSKHHVKKNDGEGQTKDDEGDSNPVNLSREGYKAVANYLQGFGDEGGPWQHVISYATSGKPMDPKHVKKVVDDIDTKLRSWKTYAEHFKFTPKDKKNLTQAKGILENSMGKKSSDDSMMAELELLAEGCPDNLDESECKEWESNTDKYQNVVKDKHQASRPRRVERPVSISVEAWDDGQFLVGGWKETDEEHLDEVLAKAVAGAIFMRIEHMYGPELKGIDPVKVPMPFVKKVVEEALQNGTAWLVYDEHRDSFSVSNRRMASESLDDKWDINKTADTQITIGKGPNGYIARYKNKEIVVMAKTTLEAQQVAAEYFKARKSWEVDVGLAEMDGKPVKHLPLMASELDDKWYGNKTAAVTPTGLYGYTRNVQSSCESSIRKMMATATKVAKEAYRKDENVAPFLAAHAKRGNSLSAKILVAAMKTIGPKVASDMRKAELLVEALPADRLTKAAARKYGLYGYAAKTASLGLQACTTLRETAGQVTAEMHGRKAADHKLITGFLSSHAKEAKCMYSKMLCASYPDADRKTASVVAPATVGEWLTWED